MLEEKKVPVSPKLSTPSKISGSKNRNSEAGKTSCVSTSSSNSSSSSSLSPAHRFSLLSEHCTSSSAPGPGTSPLLGGLPGNALLIRGHAASLQLAQLKAQLALAQMNSALAIGGQAATLTANSNAPIPPIAATAPSPTAVAINLLNLLKIANTMSHPLYNPYVPGKQSSAQGQYGLSGGPAERDPRLTMPHLGPGSSFTSSAASSVSHGNTGGKVTSILARPTSYRPESRTKVDDELERSVDLHISRAREEVRHPPVGQGPRFTNSQREEFPSSSTAVTSYMTSSASQGNRHSAVAGSGSSLDWLPIYKKSSEDQSSNIFSSSSGYLSSADGRFNTAGEGQHNMPSIPGLGDFDEPPPENPTPPTESVRPKYTSESASNILLHFGLEKEDLEHLISYPEDQITPDNLPFILRQIRIQKANRTAATSQPVPYSKPQPTSSQDRLNTTISGMNPDEMSSAILKPSKVIDYGHTGKYTAGVGKEIGRTIPASGNSGGSSNTLLMNTFSGSSHNKPPQRTTTEIKSSTVASSPKQMNSVTSFSTMRTSVAPPSSGPANRLQTQMNQASQSSVFTTFSLPKTDTDARCFIPEVQKSVPLKAPEPATSKAQPVCPLYRGVHPGRPGLVLIGSNDGGSCNAQSKTHRQVPAVSEPMKRQQTQQQRQQQQPKQPMQARQALKPQVLPPQTLVPVPSAIPGIAGVPQVSHHPTAIQKAHAAHATSSNKNNPGNVRVSTCMPTAAMLQDYAAATPKVFPHTCLLCNRECTNMKDWISHQNSNLHLDSCRVLRTRYPNWDGEIPQLQSAPGKAAKPPPAASAPGSQNRHLKSRHDSPPPPHSPHRQRGSEDWRERHRSRSRSPRYGYGYGSEGRREKRSSRSRSNSPRHYYGSEGRRERRSRSHSPPGSRRTRRSWTRSPSPRYDRPPPYLSRSRSKSHERRPFSWKRDEKRASPTRSRERRSPPPRSHERRTSAESSLRQQKRSGSTERLAKRLLETSAVQNLSKQSNLEAVVKTLAPALLAELAKMKTASSSSSTASAAPSSSTSSAAKKSAAKTLKAKPSLQKSGTSAAAQSKLGKPSPPTMVRLKGIWSALSHKDVSTAMENFGKTKSVVLFRSKLEAVVCFEKVEDADKLRNKKTFEVKGMPIQVVREKDVVSKKPPPAPIKEQKKTPQQKSLKPSATTAQVTKSTPTGKANASSLTGAPKKTTTGKLVPKAKVLVSKAKTAPTKQTAKTGKANSAAAQGGAKPVKKVKKDASELPGAKTSQTPQKKLETGDSKQTEQGMKKGPVVAPKAKGKDDVKPSNPSVSTPGKGEETAVGTTDPAPKAESTPEHKAESQSLTVATVVKEEMEESEAKDSTVTAHQSAEKPEEKAEEPSSGVMGTVVEKESGTPPELTQEVELAKADAEVKEIKEDEQAEPKEAEMEEPMETESSAEAREQNLTNTSKAIEAQAAAGAVSQPKPHADSPQIQETSSTESKEQEEISAKPLATEACDSHTPTQTVKPAPTESPADQAQSADAPLASQQPPLQASSHAQQSRIPPSDSAPAELETQTKASEPQPAAESPAEAAAKPQEGQEEAQTKQKVPVTALKTQKDSSKAASEISTAPPPEVAKTEPTLSLAAAATPPTASQKPEKQPDKSSCVPMETSLPSPPSLSEPADNEQHALQKTPAASAVPATSAGSVLSEPKTANKPGTETAARPTDTPTTNQDGEKVEEEGSAAATVLPASSSERPSKIPGRSVETLVEFPQIDADIFRAITTALREHRLTQGITAKSKVNEGTSENIKNSVNPEHEDTPQEKARDTDTADFSSDHFDQESFNFEDFVTVDEITEETEDTAEDGSPSHILTSSETKVRHASDGTPPAQKSSTRSSQDSRSLSSSKPPSISSSSASGSVSLKKQRDSSESTKSQTKPSAHVRKSSFSSASQSVEASIFSVKKAQPAKTRSSVGRRARSSAAAVKASAGTAQRVDAGAAQGAATESDQQGSADSRAAKTAESEAKIDSSSEMDPPAQAQPVQRTIQSQSPRTDLKDETLKEEKTGKGSKEWEDGKQAEEEADDGDNYQILDSLDDQVHGQMDQRETQDSSSDPQTPGPDTPHQKDHQVLDSTEDKGKACSEQCIEMRADTSSQVQKSHKDGEATGDEGSDLLTAEDSMLTQMSEGGTAPNKPSLTGEAVISEESCKTTTGMEEISDKKQPPEDRDNGDSHGQPASETVDSAGGQTMAGSDSQNSETLCDQNSVCPEEEDAYQVLDSVEDQPTNTETESEADGKGDKTKTDGAMAQREEGADRRSGLRTRASRSEEKEKSQKKQDGSAGKSKTGMKDSTTGKEQPMEEMVFEVVDSVEEEAVQEERFSRRRTNRGKKEDKTPAKHEAPEVPDREEEAVFRILDSVEDEPDAEKPTVTTRSTRARREKTKKDAENEKSNKDKTPVGRRSKSARDSEQNKEKTAPVEDTTPPAGAAQTEKSDCAVRATSEEEAAYQILDAVEEVRPATAENPRRLRPKKELKATKKQTAAAKKEAASRKRAEEEGAVYHILDSVEEEAVDSKAPKGQSEKNQSPVPEEDHETERPGSAVNEEEEEEPVYHIVDSLDDDQLLEESSTDKDESGEAGLRVVTEDEDAAEAGDSPARKESQREVWEDKSLPQFAVSCAGNESGAEKTEPKKEESPAAKWLSDAAAPEQKPEAARGSEDTAAQSALVNLDQVSEEEDDYPDDTAEEEELRRKQTAAKERRREERRARERVDAKREQRSQSSGARARKPQQREPETGEEDPQELVTLDEVGADEPMGEEAAEGPGWEISEAELQELVTLDEIVEDAEEGKEEQGTPERLPAGAESPAADIPKAKSSAAEDKNGGGEGAEQSPAPAKRRHAADDTEESFVTVDEVGKTEEEKDGAVGTKGRPKKRSRQTPVRKSTRGREGNQSVPLNSLHPPSTPEREPPAQSNADQRKEEEAANPSAEHPVRQTQEGCEGGLGKKGCKTADVKAADKRRQEPLGPEAKRSRPHSPCVAADFKLPPFNPKSPLGQEFVVPKSGFFCNLCSVFYLNESTAKETHCSSQRHYDMLLKHYQKLKRKAAALAHSSQSSVSDGST